MTSFYVFYLTRFCDFATCTLSWIQNKRSKFTSKSFWNKIARWIVTQWRRDGGTKKSVFLDRHSCLFYFFPTTLGGSVFDILSTQNDEKIVLLKLSPFPPPPLSLNVDFSTRESFKHTFTHMVPVAKKRVAISRHLSLSLSLSCSLTL